MPRSSWWNRPLAAFMALWVALVLGEPSLVHSCPVHDGGGSAVAAAAAAGHDMAGMAAGHESSVHQGGDGQRRQHHHACTCPGDCNGGGSSGVAVLRPATELAAVAAAERRSGVVRPSREASRRPRPAPPHALPFANGPPPAAPARAA